ncbi:hypothetical protein [Protaetiibacter intestinalis]|uniref:SPOR domain-containing protein n=1 Tax=Protaetiibacter intestinalis TaxID=2419774 RepID=A0A387B861_9MICO|nr:hypothetical protein [Protaetiibacter intestinalis]AYF98001.1 hypothetical protein D7I47_06855 [Protaetiibacter intestinalis]
MSIRIRIRARLALVGGAGILLALSGCAAPAPTTPEVADPPTQSDSTTDETVDTPDAPTVGGFIDPAWPWPEALPRPDATPTFETSGANPVGEGGVWSITVTVGSIDEAQAYADRLAAAGITWFTPSFADLDQGDDELGLAAKSETYMATLSVAPATLEMEFSFVGSLS